MTVEHVQKLTERTVRTEHYTYFNFRYVDISLVLKKMLFVYTYFKKNSPSGGWYVCAPHVQILYQRPGS